MAEMKFVHFEGGLTINVANLCYVKWGNETALLHFSGGTALPIMGKGNIEKLREYMAPAPEGYHD